MIIARISLFCVSCMCFCIVSTSSTADDAVPHCSSKLQSKVMAIAEALSNANPQRLPALPNNLAMYEVCSFPFPNHQTRLTFRVFIDRNSKDMYFEERRLHIDESQKEIEIVEIYGPFDPAFDPWHSPEIQ